MFVSFIGLKNAGLVIADDSNIVGLSKEWIFGSCIVTLIGVIVIGILLVLKVKGALLIGCAEPSNIIREDGTIPNCSQALLTDAVGTTIGSILGTSTVTTYVESSAGIMAGGRTGRLFR